MVLLLKGNSKAPTYTTAVYTVVQRSERRDRRKEQPNSRGAFREALAASRLMIGHANHPLVGLRCLSFSVRSMVEWFPSQKWC